jgi:hypothetical protein
VDGAEKSFLQEELSSLISVHEGNVVLILEVVLFVCLFVCELECREYLQDKGVDRIAFFAEIRVFMEILLTSWCRWILKWMSENVPVACIHLA